MKLISLKNVQDMCAPGMTEIIISADQIITPSAKDFLKNKDIAIVYSKNKQKHDSTKKHFIPDQELIHKVTNILVNNYKITDKNELSKLVLQIIQNINK